MKRLFLFCMTLLSIFIVTINTASANDNRLPSYDYIPITPQTWQEVDLSYTDIIKDKEYPAEIKLIRPISWLQHHGMEEIGNKVKLSIPEFGVVDVVAIVKAIKPTKLDTSKIDWLKQNSRPVIGTFKRYTTDVRSYTFKDEQGNVDKINATSNHRFYVQNRTVIWNGEKTHFIPIKNISPNDKLVSQKGKQVKLVCSNGKTKNCGEIYNKNSNPVTVYNLEVYNNHVYYVGDNTIMVHNIGCGPEDIMAEGNYIFSDNFEYRYNYSLNHAYRIDTRPFSEIGVDGFSGTVGENHIIPSFNKQTVFSSADLDGVNNYYDSVKTAFPDNTYFLYKINTRGLRTLSFRENFNIDTEGFLNKLTDDNITRNFERYSATKRYQRSFDGFHDYIYKKLELSINDAFLPLNEVHIEGPIDPSRIESLGVIMR